MILFGNQTQRRSFAYDNISTLKDGRKKDGRKTESLTKNQGRIDRLRNSEVLELAPMNFITIVIIIIIINIIIIDMIIFTF